MASKYNTKELIEELHASGLTHKDYCSKNNIAPSTLAYHLKKYRISCAQEKKEPSTGSFLPVDLCATGNSRICSLIIMKGDFSSDDLVRIVSSGL